MGKAGRPKGAKNRTTEAIKEAYTLLLHNNLDNMTEWIEKVAEKNPEKAYYMLVQLNEYVIPKLARTDGSFDFGKNINSILDDIDRRVKEKAIQQGMEIK